MLGFLIGNMQSGFFSEIPVDQDRCKIFNSILTKIVHEKSQKIIPLTA
jgi:hypothetical protein